MLLCALGYAEGGALARELGGVQVICLALVLMLPVTAALTLARLDTASLVRATPAAWAGFAYVLLTWNQTAGWIVTDRHRRHVVRGPAAREHRGEVARPGPARTSR